MNAWLNIIAFVLANIFHGVVAPGGGVGDPINTCKAQYHALYETEWDLDLTNRKPECAQQCLDKLSNKQDGGTFWQGCYHDSACDNYCKCTLDSDSIVRGYATFVDAVGNIRSPTEGFKSWFAERFEGTMYVAYDCRRYDPMGSRSKTGRNYKSKAGRDYNYISGQDNQNGWGRHSSKRSRFAYWRR